MFNVYWLYKTLLCWSSSQEEEEEEEEEEDGMKIDKEETNGGGGVEQCEKVEEADAKTNKKTPSR